MRRRTASVAFISGVIVAGTCWAGCATKGEERVLAPARGSTPVSASSITPIATSAPAVDAAVGSAGAEAPSAEVADAAPLGDEGKDESACGTAPKVDPKARLGVARAGAGGGLMDPTMGESGFGFYRVAHAPTVAAGAPLRISLTGPSSVKVGQPMKLVATAENSGKTPLILGLAVDGSLEHWRSPYVDLYAKDDVTGHVYRWDYQGGRCGNVNTRTPKDFVTLAPSGKRSPAFGEWASHVNEAMIDKTGRFTVWVVYTSCHGKDMGLELGVGGKVPTPWYGVAASDPITIHVQP